MGFDPIAAAGMPYDPNGDESFLVTATRGMGEMSSPIDPAGILSIGYSLATDAKCQEAVANAASAVFDYLNDSFSGMFDSVREQSESTRELFYNTDLD